MGARGKSLLALLLLLLAALPVFAVVATLWLVNQFRAGKTIEPSGRTVLLTGGKMTKCLQLARMFKSLGDRVVVVETPAYRWCGTRFSRSVDAFHVVPKYGRGRISYEKRLAKLAIMENVDLIVPVSSPAAAYHEAKSKEYVRPETEVFQFDESVIEVLDDKFAFCQLCHEYGLSAPEVVRIEAVEDLLNYDFPPDKRYILKSINYDPVYRLDLRTLPHPGWRERVAALPIQPDNPWVLQEFVEGREVCTHSTIRDGKIRLYVCSDSSPFQVNYRMLDLPEVHHWVSRFAEQLGGKGQASFDFILTENGRVMPIECNPRTHSAITLFHDQPEAATGYWSDGSDTYQPRLNTTPTYWLYHEVQRWWRAGSNEERSYVQNRIRRGKDAVFNSRDPWPFFGLNHVQIPRLLWQKLIDGSEWEKIDFNIGKLVEAGGD